MLIALFRLLSFFPLPVLHAIGASLGWLVYLTSPSYRRRLQENIQQAGFTEHTFRAVSEAGKTMFELPFIWYGRPERVLRKAKIEGWEVAQQILDQHQGAIFLTPHLGCFEITAQAIATKVPLTALYRTHRKRFLQPLIEEARSRHNLILLPANLTGVRNMLKTLKKGMPVGLLPDQAPQQGEGVWADFFNRPAYTMTLPFKLHRMTGAPIILSYAKRLSWGRGFIVRFVPFTPTAQSIAKPEQAINSAMEKLIAECPAQYLWSYNRYKQPANAPAVPPSMNGEQ